MTLGVSAPRDPPRRGHRSTVIAKFKDDYAPAWLLTVATAALAGGFDDHAQEVVGVDPAQRVLKLRGRGLQ
jgi:hypothetical protein